jgi:hypothetical protein
MADHHQSEHKHGSMDIRAQQAAFSGFILGSKIVAGLSVAILIFMALANA